MSKLRLVVYSLAIPIILVDAALTLRAVYWSTTVSTLNAALPVLSLLTLAGIVLTFSRRTATRGTLVVLIAVVAKLMLLGPASLWHLSLLACVIAMMLVAMRTGLGRSS